MPIKGCGKETFFRERHPPIRSIIDADIGTSRGHLACVPDKKLF
jgi:hypothetical protein